MKIDFIAETYKHIYWLDLLIDENVLNLLSSKFFESINLYLKDCIGPLFIKYSNHTIRSNDKTTNSDEDSNQIKSKIFATWGARSIDNAGPLQDLRTMMSKLMMPWRNGKYFIHI